MRGLVALQEADEAMLAEPEHGYVLPGLSFTPNELFAEIRKHHPGFGYRVELDENMNKFAKLWPDKLSGVEPLRDLGYTQTVDLPTMVKRVNAAHEGRNARTAQAFREIGGADGSGRLSRAQITSYVRKYLVRGREQYAHEGQSSVDELMDTLMNQLDASGDGFVSWLNFSEWNRRNSLEAALWKKAASTEDELRKQLIELGQRPRA